LEPLPGFQQSLLLKFTTSARLKCHNLTNTSFEAAGLARVELASMEVADAQLETGVSDFELKLSIFSLLLIFSRARKVETRDLKGPNALRHEAKSAANACIVSEPDESS